MSPNIKNKIVPYVLGGLQTFIGVTAILGGFGLVSDPSGTKVNVPLELLKNSPFINYLIPGLVLLAVIGIGNILAGGATFLRSKHAGIIAFFFGAFLALFIVIEVWIIGVQNFLQPLYLVLGMVEFVLGWKLSKSDKGAHPPWIESTGAKLPV